MAETIDPQFAGTIDLETGKMEPIVDATEVGFIESEGATIEKPIETATEVKPAEGAKTEDVSRETTRIDYYKSLNEEAGTQFENNEGVVNEIKASRALKEKLTDYETKLKTFEGLDPIAFDIDRARKAGIELDLYLEAVKMDTSKLDAKQALKEDFLRKNAELVATDREFAVLKFERDYKARYGKLDETLDTTGLDEFEVKAKILEFNQEQDFIKRSKNADHVQAVKSLNEWKKKHITIPDAPQQKGMTDEHIQQYYSQADTFVVQNDKIEIPIGDKKFNFGLKDYAETLKGELRNPIETLKKHGIDIPNGIIDAVKLGKLLTSAYVAQNLAKPLATWMQDSKNIEFLKDKKDKPAPSQSTAGGALPIEDDLLAQFSKGIEAKMAAQRQS